MRSCSCSPKWRRKCQVMYNQPRGQTTHVCVWKQWLLTHIFSLLTPIKSATEKHIAFTNHVTTFTPLTQCLAVFANKKGMFISQTGNPIKGFIFIMILKETLSLVSCGSFSLFPKWKFCQFYQYYFEKSSSGNHKWLDKSWNDGWHRNGFTALLK